MTENELFEKLQDNLAAEIQAREDKKKALPTPFRIGPFHTLREAAEQLGVRALQKLTHGRAYALDAEGRLELAALATACIQSKKNLSAVLETLASVVPGWLQDRPPDDAGVVPVLETDPVTGQRIRNPWLPLAPLKPGETTPHFDFASQNVIRETTPRLATWLIACAKNGGQPSAAMMDELQAEKIDAEQMKKIPYDAKTWEENKLRADYGADLTQKNLFVRSIENPYLLRLHRSEAKLGSPRCGYNNLTHRMALARRNPEVREVHRKAEEIFATWQQEAKEKAAA
jgi:hypothetical protein